MNQQSFSSFAEAQGGDVIDFEIIVRNNGNVAESVTVLDILPSGFIYRVGSTHVNNKNTTNDSVIAGGISVGTINPGSEVRVRFRADVSTTIVEQIATNRASAIIVGKGNVFDGFINVTIRNRGQVLGVGDIVTGPMDTLPIVLFSSFVASVLFVRHRMIERWEG